MLLWKSGVQKSPRGVQTPKAQPLIRLEGRIHPERSVRFFYRTRISPEICSIIDSDRRTALECRICLQTCRWASSFPHSLSSYPDSFRDPAGLDMRTRTPLSVAMPPVATKSRVIQHHLLGAPLPLQEWLAWFYCTVQRWLQTMTG